MRKHTWKISLMFIVGLSVFGCDVGHNNFPGPNDPWQYHTLAEALNDSANAYSLSLVGFGDSLAPDIGKLKNLRILEIHAEKLRYLPEEFTELQSLEELYIENTMMQSIPQQVFSLPALKVLSFKDNVLRDIPEELQRMPTLQKLLLKGNGLTTFQVVPGAFQNLTELDLWDNALSTFHTAPGAFSKLDKLILGKNKLRRVPEAVDSIPLRWLDLQYDSIRTIPNWLQHKRGLDLLNLTWTGLTTFRSEPGAYQDLKYLYLYHNSLTDFPVAEGAYPQLQRLGLIGNPIPEEIRIKIRARLPNTDFSF